MQKWTKKNVSKEGISKGVLIPLLLYLSEGTFTHTVP